MYRVSAVVAMVWLLAACSGPGAPGAISIENRMAAQLEMERSARRFASSFRAGGMAAGLATFRRRRSRSRST